MAPTRAEGGPRWTGLGPAFILFCVLTLELARYFFKPTLEKCGHPCTPGKKISLEHVWAGSTRAWNLATVCFPHKARRANRSQELQVQVWARFRCLDIARPARGVSGCCCSRKDRARGPQTRRWHAVSPKHLATVCFPYQARRAKGFKYSVGSISVLGHRTPGKRRFGLSLLEKRLEKIRKSLTYEASGMAQHEYQHEHPESTFCAVGFIH